MAYRNDVTARTKCRSEQSSSHSAIVIVALVFALGACSGNTPPPKDLVNRGQVIDQDTGQPIPGVIVVGIYEGSVRGSGASSCNRVETTISDENGWFELPLDSKAGPLSMEGYHKDYRHGYPVRVPTCGINGDPNQCQIWQDSRDENDHVVSIVKEPMIYHGEAEATKAARYLEDLYLKRFKGTREQRLRELHRLVAANSCLATPRRSQGLIPFLEAIEREQIAMGDSRDGVRITNEQMETAKKLLEVRK